MDNPNKKEIGLNVKEIVFLNNEEEKSFCDIFVYEPENIEEQALGNLYVIGEVSNFPENSSYLLNLLASIIKKEFYSKTKRPAIESLEASLNKANSTLSDFAQQGNTSWVGNLNMACGVYSGGVFYLSQVGKIKTLLIRNRQITDIGKNINKEEKNSPFRTFANIASGELEINDLVLVATSEFFNIFSLEKLRQLSSLDFENMVNNLRDSIEKEEDINMVSALIMQTEEKKIKKDKLQRVEIKTVAETEREIASDPHKDQKQMKTTFQEEINIGSNVKKISLEEIISEYEKIKEDENPEVKTQKTDHEIIEENVRDMKEEEESNNILETDNEEEKSEAGVLNNLAEKSTGALKRLKSKTDLAAISSYGKNMLNRLKGQIPDDMEIKNDMPLKINLLRKNRFLAIAFALILMLAIGSFLLTDYRKKEEAKLKFYENVLSQAREKMDQAEILLINNEPEAKDLLMEAKNLALEVKNSYPKLNNNATAIFDKIQNQLDIADHVNRIDNPRVAIDLSQTEKPADAAEIIKINKGYYTFDKSGNSIYKIDLIGKKISAVQTENSSIEKFKLSTALNKTEEIVFVQDSNKIAVFDTNKKKLSILDSGLLDNLPNIKDISSFGNYIYILDPASNQIYKSQRTSEGFSKTEPWMKDREISLESAISIAIDGSIYILKSDGVVEKYLTGNKKPFSIEKLSEPIADRSKIYTEPDLKNIYIIDPKKNRIILFDKGKGSLKKQYTSNGFNNLKNVVVDEKKNKMYVLNGEKIFEVDDVEN